MTHDCQHSLWGSRAQPAASRSHWFVGALRVAGRSASRLLHSVLELVKRMRLSGRTRMPSVDSGVRIAGSHWVSLTHGAWQGKEDIARLSGPLERDEAIRSCR